MHRGTQHARRQVLRPVALMPRRFGSAKDVNEAEAMIHNKSDLGPSTGLECHFGSDEGKEEEVLLSSLYRRPRPVCLIAVRAAALHRPGGKATRCYAASRLGLLPRSWVIRSPSKASCDFLYETERSK